MNAEASTKQKEGGAAYWEAPLLFGQITPPDIPATLLPGWLGEYVKAVSDNTQTPPGLAVMLSLSVVATCLQKRFVISPYGDDYKEPLNIWTATSLPPASRKTAVISALTGPIDQWEKGQAEIMEDDIRLTKIKIAGNKKRIDELTRKVSRMEKPKDREKIFHEIAQIEKDTPKELLPPQLWTSDVTPEELQMLLAKHGEKMALLSDEGGIFEIMAGLYSEGRANLDIFLQAHAGKGMRVNRASREAHLNAPALTFGLAIQPSIVAELSRGSKKRFRGNGALARFLYCLPKNNIGTRNVREHILVPDSVKSQYQFEISNLLNISPMTDSSGHEQPRELKLDPDALESWLTFSQEVEDKQGPAGEYETIQDWTGKLPGATLRIAGLFHVVEHSGSTLTVNEQTMERAIELSKLLIEHAKAAFDLMGADKATDDAKAVYRWIVKKQNHTFTQRECHNSLQSRFPKVDSLKTALEDLQKRTIISKPIKESTGGCPSTHYAVNPAIVPEDLF